MSDEEEGQMTGLIKKTVMAVALGATAISAAAPASAQRWHGGGYGWHGGGHYYRGGWGPGAAVGAGILGFALGAAATSSPRYGYGYGYYDRPYGYDYYPRCHRVMRWDPYYDDYVPVRYCD
jgi:hypothetical protein